MEVVGFYFGSFDPPHLGHYNMIKEALKYVSKVIIVPAWKNRWKQEAKAAFECRVGFLEMIARDIDPRRVIVSDIEKKLAKEDNQGVPTYRTLFELSKGYPNFKIITSSETYRDISKWKNGDDILEMNEFIIFNRPGYNSLPGAHDIESDLVVSSTELKKKIKNGEGINSLIPDIIPTKKYLELYG